jgi:ribosomal protein S12 methylthiotransferase
LQIHTCWLNIYGEFALPRLLRELCKVDGIEWIRLMYCYEDRITDELIAAMAREPKVLHYIDIPLQHSSDNVLSRMNRHSTNASIRRTLGKLRAAMPDISIRTTLMTGFPGETDEDFEALADFVAEQKFERMGVFAFSPEEDTAAWDMDGQVDSEMAAERRDSLMLIQLDNSLENNRRLVGETVTVLVEGSEEEGVYFGRTYRDAPEIDNSVIFEAASEHSPGDFTSVIITDAMDYDIIGKEIETVY